MPSPLQPEIQEHLNINDRQFNGLYSARALSGMFMPLATGILISKWGLYAGLFLFVTLAFVGQAMVTLGIYWEIYNVCLIGRVIFGCCDCVTIA